ncbi:MAG: Fur family transcriptional regulator [Planctomycetota bacterium]
MSDKEKDRRERLEEHGLRRTRWRVRILAELTEAGRPLSHSELMERLGPTADRVTAYRTLDAFVRVGLAEKVLVDDRSALYGVRSGSGAERGHPHFVCRGCGAAVCLPDLDVPELPRRRKGYVFERHRLVFEGLCPKCVAGE